MDNEHMLLELDHISKIYGDLHAVDDLSLTVPQGQWLAIVGSSGSGKTTLMNMIGCMDTPSKGSVMLEGRRLEDLNARQLADVRKNMIGLVFQKFYLVPHLTAVENVMVAQYYHSVVDEKQAMEALERVGLKERAHHLPGQLSGGEQQRVCIARALITSDIRAKLVALKDFEYTDPGMGYPAWKLAAVNRCKDRMIADILA